MFKELKKETAPHHNVSAKKRKTLNSITKHCFEGGAVNFLSIVNKI
jgi:hypothetical protein